MSPQVRKGLIGQPPWFHQVAVAVLLFGSMSSCEATVVTEDAGLAHGGRQLLALEVEIRPLDEFATIRSCAPINIVVRASDDDDEFPVKHPPLHACRPLM